jgi:hypothetical protein
MPFNLTAFLDGSAGEAEAFAVEIFFFLFESES